MTRVHFLGIEGSGASGAAAIAKAYGFEVTGCDLTLSGHSPKHLDNVDILAVTPAIFSLDPDNPELLEAKKKNIKIMTWQEFTGEYLAKEKFVIAVAGTHGKTTTTAMVAKILEDAKLDPTVLLGAIVPKWKANYRIGKGRYLVIEADEYYDNFLNFYPELAVITNIEMDHPEYFKDFADYKKSFAKFKNQSKKVFDKPIGKFNAANASLALEVGLALGIDKEIIKKSLASFEGVSRRFEYIGEYNNAKVYSDFGHHPTEIKVTVEAAKQKFPEQRLLLIYQPHMFSRTKALFSDFVKVFQEVKADKTYIMDIYPSREIDTGLVSSKQLVDSINKNSVIYIENPVLNKLKPEIKSGDIVLFMSAGDTDRIARELVAKNVLIFGLGLNQGGVGSSFFFAKKRNNVKVTDLKNADILKPSLDQLKKYKNISYTLGGHKKEDIDWADIIIKNPAIKPGNIFIEYAKTSGKQIETDMGVFLQYVKPSQIIGITGTKGKSTTASLIYEVLQKAGKKTVLSGNIGKSVLGAIPDIKPGTLVVLEISSFQLEAFEQHKISPKYAVITNITPDHLNYYKNMEEYIAAKKIITKYQTKNDYLFIKEGSRFDTQAKVIYFSKDDLPKDFHPKLLGEHNLENIAAAYAVVKALGLQGYTLRALEDFPGMEFRMQLIYDRDNIKIYNDTAATSPEAGIKALETFPGCILICGGMNKGMDYTKYASVIKQKAKKVYFLKGDAMSAFEVNPYDNLEKLLMAVKKEVTPGDIILFSPAATSFNLFQNEFDRGRKFNEAVEKVFG